MTRTGRLRAESLAAARAFLRRRTAVFFTFVFPVLIVGIFGIVVQTQPTGGGLFAQPPGYYVPGYLAVVVLFTPLSRVGSEVARHRADNRFEKLATTPLTRPDWLLAQSIVNTVIIGLAAALLLGLILLGTGAQVRFDGLTLLVVPYVIFGVAVFCGIGAMLGAWTGSRDGVIAASNTVALPLLFLSETFVPPSMLPAWLPTGLSPLTYFSRGVRAVTYRPSGEILASTGVPDPWVNLGVLAALAVVAVGVGAAVLPVTD
jgi:ABC-2 type transport system permease protein